MAALTTSASSCGSALATTASSYTSRGFCVGRSARVPLLPGSVRWTTLSVRATTSTEQASTSTATTSIPSSSTTEETTVQEEDLVADLKAKWDAIENKTNVFIYGGGALAALWFSTTILGAVNSVPLLPKLLELVGLGYSFWFVYRYLLFKENRKELTKEIEQLKVKLTE